jgi:hypothetical protein
VGVEAEDEGDSFGDQGSFCRVDVSLSESELDEGGVVPV